MVIQILLNHKNMKAELKGFQSPDVYDLEKYYPELEDNFCFYLEISVGPKNEKGSEQFGITVCTPKWLLDNKIEDGVIFGKNYLIVFYYDYKKLYNKIKSYIDKQNGNSWEELALKIGRISYWEFEDYQEQNRKGNVPKVLFRVKIKRKSLIYKIQEKKVSNGKGGQLSVFCYFKV